MMQNPPTGPLPQGEGEPTSGLCAPASVPALPPFHPGCKIVTTWRLGLKIRALAESGLQGQARALAQGIVVVLSYPDRCKAGLFDDVDFAKLPGGLLTVEAVGLLPWRHS